MSRCVEIVMAGVATTLAFGLEPAMAQEKQEAEFRGIETVVVTSQKRSEDSQKVALTVKALDSQALKLQQIDNISDLAEAVPGFAVQKVGGGHRPALRGMSIQSSGAWQEGFVATYVDGVYMVDPASSNGVLNGLERVEVIKGPQGTLFGRNSVGGVVSYITKDPTHAPSLDVAVGYGNYDALYGSLYGTAGIADTLAANIAFAGEDQQGGWGTNLYNGNSIHNGYKFSVRSKLLWTPNDTTRITLSGDWSRADSLEVGSASSRGVFPFIVAGPRQVGGFYDTYSPNDSIRLSTNYGGSVRAEFDLGWSQFLSISAARRGSQVSGTPDPFDQPYLPATPDVGQPPALRTVSEINHGNPNTTLTQEFQLLSPDSSRIKWVGGVFLLKDASGIRDKIDTRIVSNGPPWLLSTGATTRQDTESYSVFAEATWPLFAGTRLTTGARYTSDHKSVRGFATANTLANQDVFTITPGSSEASNPVPSKTWSKPTYKLSLERDLGADALVYATFSTGFQSAFYPISNNASAPPLEPMTLDGLELGVKSEFLDNRLRVNVAVFNYDLDNVIVSNFADGSQNQRNAATSRIRGADLDVTLRPFEALTITANAQLLDAKYTDYKNAIVFVPDLARNVYVTSVGDLTGENLQFSEKFVGNTTASYLISTGVGDFVLAGALSYHSGTYYDAQDLNTQPSYTLINASVGWTSPTDKFDVKLWSQNLADKVYAASLQVGTLNKYNPAEPRTYGIRFGYRWN